MTNKNIPCKDCLLISVCKHKKYMRLFRECSLISNYVPFYDHVGRRSDAQLNELRELLKPTKWRLEVDYSGDNLVEEDWEHDYSVQKIR